MLSGGKHRGYIVDHESEAGLKREIDLAAEVGAEMFVVDAGWYGPEPNHWGPNVGDWYAGAWLPNDLTPVREYARGKGLDKTKTYDVTFSNSGQTVEPPGHHLLQEGIPIHLEGDLTSEDC